MAIEPEKRGSGDLTEWRWTCSLCGKKGPWWNDAHKVLDAGEQHAKSEHPRTEKGDN